MHIFFPQMEKRKNPAIKKIKIYDTEGGDVIFDGGWFYYNGYNYVHLRLSSSLDKYICISAHAMYNISFCKKNKMIEYINYNHIKNKKLYIYLNPYKIYIQFTDVGWISFIKEFKHNVSIYLSKKK